MAERIMKYYAYVDKELGFSGRIHLAQLTKIPSVRAAMEPDTPENIKMFQDAIAKLTNKPAPNL